MSLGGILGGFVGGVIGFFIGGPVGAIYGASIGFGVGTFVDPITPDVPTPGSPKPESSVMQSTVGDPCPDLCGTAIITGHLLAYGNEHNSPVYVEQETSGGKGGGAQETPKQISGYDYYMSWQLGICRGPIKAIRAIYKNEDELLWEGPLFLPASGGMETIVISGFGSIDFYFGTTDQVANSSLGAITDATLNSPLRNFCWAFMNDCKIGGYPRTPTLSFVVSKFPTSPYDTGGNIQKYDALPFSSIYYIMNTLGGLPATWLNSADFEMADYTSKTEYRGISALLKDNTSMITYVQAILNHVDGIINYGIDGKFHPKLIRGDYTVASLPLINEDDLLDDPEITRPSWINTINEIKPQYNEIYNVGERKNEYYGTLYWFGVNGYYKDVHDGATTDKQTNADIVPDIEDWKVSKVDSGSPGAGGCWLFRDDGLVYARGGVNDLYGHLGIGNKTLRPPWTQVLVGQDVPEFWSRFVSGGSFSIGLANSGSLYLAGYNGSRRLHVQSSDTYVTTHSQEYDSLTWSEYFDAGYGNTNWGQRILLCDTPLSNIRVTPNLLSVLVGAGANLQKELGLDCPSILDENVALYDGSPGTIVGIWCGNFISTYGIGNPESFEVYSAGKNNQGQCGIGSFVTPVYPWTKVLGGPWKFFHTSGSHLVAVKIDGTLWSCGVNDVGQLGQGDITNRHTMTQMGTASNWVKCWGTNNNTYAINDDGEVWACGKNSQSQCGSASAGSLPIKTLTREGSNGIWVSVFPFANGCFLLK